MPVQIIQIRINIFTFTSWCVFVASSDSLNTALKLNLVAANSWSGEYGVLKLELKELNHDIPYEEIDGKKKIGGMLGGSNAIASALSVSWCILSLLVRLFQIPT